eukprot:jgi/Galph1/4198/GphlegSOOS_G2850.1
MEGKDCCLFVTNGNHSVCSWITWKKRNFTSGCWLSRKQLLKERNKTVCLAESIKPLTNTGPSKTFTTKTLQVGILGASGYTGIELVRILVNHPQVNLRVMTAARSAGKTLGSVFGQYLYSTGRNAVPDTLMDSVSLFEDTNLLSSLDVIFCCLPHGSTQEYVLAIPSHVKVIDLSADFRLKEPENYHQWYGKEHKAPKLQQEAVYGLVEVNRSRIQHARLVANPGSSDIVIDAKSGASGAGRSLKESSLFCEVHEGLSIAFEQPIQVNFTPHLIPISRGILESIYIKLAPGVTVMDLRKCLQDAYKDEYFVTLLPSGIVPQTRFVRGTNHCLINVFEDRLPNRAIIFSVIDNLVKGASGQAVQNMNVLFDLPEEMSLEAAALFP